MNNILWIVLLLCIAGCSIDEHPSYDPLVNDLPSGGPTIKYDPNSSLTNVQELQNNLSEKHKIIFTKSLSWYGTESNYGFERINNKTAQELVNIVNCLKITDPKKQENCFDKRDT